MGDTVKLPLLGEGVQWLQFERTFTAYLQHRRLYRCITTEFYVPQPINGAEVEGVVPVLNARDILNAELDNDSAVGAIRLALDNQTYTLVQADEVNVTPFALWARLKALKGSDTAEAYYLAVHAFDNCKPKPGESSLLFVTRMANDAELLNRVQAAIPQRLLVNLIILRLNIEHVYKQQWFIQDDLTIPRLVQLVAALQTTTAIERRPSALLSTNASKPAETRGFKAPQTDQSSRVTCHWCQKRGHKEVDCRSKKSGRPKANKSTTSVPTKNEGQNFAFAVEVCANSISDYGTSSHRIVLDTGATNHMVTGPDLLQDVRSTIHHTVRFGDSSCLPVTEEGDLHIGGTVLKNALSVPGLRFCLISGSKLCEAGYSGITEKNWARFDHPNGTSLLFILVDGLYEYIQEQSTASGAFASDSKPSEATPVNSIEDLHLRLGHASGGTLSKYAKDLGLAKSEPLGFCLPCATANHPKKKFGIRSEVIATSPGSFVSDVAGPFSTTAFKGVRYFVSWIDLNTLYGVLIGLQKKSQVTQAIIDQVTLFNNLNTAKVQKITSDGGGEYTSEILSNFAADHGIQLLKTVPYTPQLNGTAERFNRTIMEKVRAMMLDTGHPSFLWLECASYACIVRNFTPTSKLATSPYAARYGKQPDLKLLKPWGCLALAKIDNSLRTKLDPQSTKGWFVGIDLDNLAYRIWFPETNSVLVRREVRFMEENRGREGIDSAFNQEEVKILYDGAFGEAESAQQFNTMPLYELAEPLNEEEPVTESQFQAPPQVIDSDSDSDSELELNSEEEQQIQEINEQETPEAPVKLSHHGRPVRAKKVLRLPDFVYSEDESFLSTAGAGGTRQVLDLIRGPDGPKWKEAMKKELQSLLDFDTWTYVDRPPGANLLTCLWVLKIKPETAAEQETFKARLVVRGNQQIEGEDYSETFAPVVRFETVRLLISLDAQGLFELHSMDVSTAFLNGFIKEDIYMSVPFGLSMPNKVCKLHRSLYGLKQSPRMWHNELSSFLLEIGFVRSGYEPCVFIKKSNKFVSVVAVYVDDLLLGCSRGPHALQELKKAISSKFTVRDLGPVKSFLSINIVKTPEFIKLDQRDKILALLVKYGLSDCKSAPTPLDPGTQLTKDDCPQTKEEMLAMTRFPYRAIIGSLLFISVCSRPDIAFAVNSLSQFMHNPGMIHWKALQRVLRYLSGTAGYCLKYSRSAAPKFDAYVDSNWGGDLDNRRSTSGFIVRVNGSPVQWRSVRQRSVALSTMEAEYMALAEVTKEIIWFRGVLGELDLLSNKPTTVYEDNQSCILLAQERRFHGQAKHINIRYNFIRDCVQDGTIQLEYCSSTEMVADALTKHLGRVAYQRLVALMHLNDEEASSHGEC